MAISIMAMSPREDASALKPAVVGDQRTSGDLAPKPGWRRSVTSRATATTFPLWVWRHTSFELTRSSVVAESNRNDARESLTL
jgi:hypothetical protein